MPAQAQSCHLLFESFLTDHIHMSLMLGERWPYAGHSMSGHVRKSEYIIPRQFHWCLQKGLLKIEGWSTTGSIHVVLQLKYQVLAIRSRGQCRSRPANRPHERQFPASWTFLGMISLFCANGGLSLTTLDDHILAAINMGPHAVALFETKATPILCFLKYSIASLACPMSSSSSHTTPCAHWWVRNTRMSVRLIAASEDSHDR